MVYPQTPQQIDSASSVGRTSALTWVVGGGDSSYKERGMGAGFRFALSRAAVALYLGTLSCILGCGTPSAPKSAAKSEIIPQAEREVTFLGTQGVKLAGTLLIPVHEQDTQVAGVIIVAGSGPTDRNGNQPGLTIDLLKQIAE